MTKHLIDLNDYSTEQWNEIISLAGQIMRNPHIYECLGKPDKTNAVARGEDAAQAGCSER